MKIDLKMKAAELKKSMDNLSEAVQEHFETAIGQLSLMAYNEAIRLASQRLNTTRDDYLNNLKYEKVGSNIYVIYLDDAANHLEDGYGPYEMLPNLATSHKGGKHHTAKDGHEYVHVPIQTQPYSKTPSKVDVTNLRSAIKAIEKDKSIARVIKETEQGKITYFKGIKEPNLQGLVKVTKPYGKTKQSSFLVFRTASEKQDPTLRWRHPGFKGAHVFQDVEKFVDQQLDNIIKKLL